MTEVYEHQACEQEMRRIHEEWEQYWQKHAAVRGVVLSSPEGNRWMQITDVEYGEDGIVIYVE